MTMATPPQQQVQGVRLRPVDVEAQERALDFAVREYQWSKKVCLVAFPAVSLGLAYLLYATVERYLGVGNDLTFRWLRVAIPPAAGVWYFFYYGIVHVFEALHNIKQPGYELCTLGAADGGAEGGGGAATTAAVPLPTPPTAAEGQAAAAWEEAQRVYARAVGVAAGVAAPIVLRARYSERLGNNVFQYVMARLRAAHLGLDFVAPPLGAPFAGAPSVVRAGDHAPQLCPWAAAGGDGGAAAVALRSSPAWRRVWLAWLSQPVSGYVLNTEMLAGYEAAVRRWLRPTLDAAATALPSGTLRTWAPSDVVLHVRLGDILWGHHAAYRPLPFSFYRAALHAIASRLRGTGGGDAGATSPAALAAVAGSLGRVIIVTEDNTHEIVVRLAHHLRAACGCTVETQSASLTADFLALLHAPNLVVSISSFAWWAAFLGDAATVVFPRFGLLARHTWHPRPDVTALHDLTLHDALPLPTLLAAAGVTVPSSSSLPAAGTPLADLLSATLCQAGVSHAAPFEWQPGARDAALSPPASATAAGKAAGAGAAASSDADATTLVAAVTRALDGRPAPPALTAAVGRPSPRAVVIPQPQLQRWDGDFRHTMVSLFD